MTVDVNNCAQKNVILQAMPPLGIKPAEAPDHLNVVIQNPKRKPNSTHHSIKPAKFSSVDFEAVPVAAEKVQMGQSLAHQMTRKLH